MQRRQARKIVAHSASCGWRIRAMFFQPRRGERMCRRFLSPLRGSGHTRRMPLFPQLALWATIFRPLRGLISVTHYRECFDPLETLCRMSNSYDTCSSHAHCFPVLTLVPRAPFCAARCWRDAERACPFMLNCHGRAPALGAFGTSSFRVTLGARACKRCAGALLSGARSRG